MLKITHVSTVWHHATSVIRLIVYLVSWGIGMAVAVPPNVHQVSMEMTILNSVRRVKAVWVAPYRLHIAPVVKHHYCSLTIGVLRRVEMAITAMVRAAKGAFHHAIRVTKLNVSVAVTVIFTMLRVWIAALLAISEMLILLNVRVAILIVQHAPATHCVQHVLLGCVCSMVLANLRRVFKHTMDWISVVGVSAPAVVILVWLVLPKVCVRVALVDTYQMGSAIWDAHQGSLATIPVRLARIA